MRAAIGSQCKLINRGMTCVLFGSLKIFQANMNIKSSFSQSMIKQIDGLLIIIRLSETEQLKQPWNCFHLTYTEHTFMLYDAFL